jgi:hypothetical protein
MRDITTAAVGLLAGILGRSEAACTRLRRPKVATSVSFARERLTQPARSLCQRQRVLTQMTTGPIELLLRPWLSPGYQK